MVDLSSTDDKTYEFMGYIVPELDADTGLPHPPAAFSNFKRMQERLSSPKQLAGVVLYERLSDANSRRVHARTLVIGPEKLRRGAVRVSNLDKTTLAAVDVVENQPYAVVLPQENKFPAPIDLHPNGPNIFVTDRLGWSFVLNQGDSVVRLSEKIREPADPIELAISQFRDYTLLSKLGQNPLNVTFCNKDGNYSNTILG